MKTPSDGSARNAETLRLEESWTRAKNWQRWGTYLAERQWGTVREDYSADGNPWAYFPHSHAPHRAYRWGEDGLLGICDRECRLAFALALWNGRDPVLKERLFGLSNQEGNHGEDVKECYFYLDATPTCSYAKALYKYPQAEFPYSRLVAENSRRGRSEPEFELTDTGIFAENRYFDVVAEYAKADPDDILIRITIVNRGPEPAPLDVLPTLWFRNTWAWGRSGESYWPKPALTHPGGLAILAEHSTLGLFVLRAEPAEGADAPALLFTDNETNAAALFDSPSASPYTKDALHDVVIRGRSGAVNPDMAGTKAAVRYRLQLPAGAASTIRLRLSSAGQKHDRPFDAEFDRTVAQRIDEADAFHAALDPPGITAEERLIIRQARAGLLWSRQFYHYIVRDWLSGDPPYPPPPPARAEGRNRAWVHLYNRDVISMPDKWEYPWYAAWDLGFHLIPFAAIDPDFAKQQLLLFLREWYMHPNGQLPAYEFDLSAVNPPVQAWAAWRIYKMTGARGRRDRLFLKRVFQKLLLNFTWWVNRQDVQGNNLFTGGYLGLDNIGVFDRSRRLPGGGTLSEADATAWVAFYCGEMLAIALELASEDPAYEDLASKFFEHYVAVADAMNTIGTTGLWDEADGFYYDQLRVDGATVPLRVRSMVGIIPLFAVANLDRDVIDRLPGFTKRMAWFLENRKDLASHMQFEPGTGDSANHRLLSIPTRDRLVRTLAYVLDEREFLSPYGVQSLSRYHRDHPFALTLGGEAHRVEYVPGDSDSPMFGGNSNWRGPVWIPVNYLLIEALERYGHFFGGRLAGRVPDGIGKADDAGRGGE